MSRTVALPAPSPWDVDAVSAAALDVLRLEDTDPDAGRIVEAAKAATMLVDSYLDYAASPWTTTDEIPAPVVAGAVNLTVELYRRKDAPFGVVDAWGTDGSLVRLSPDLMRGTYPYLSRFRGRWGLA